MFELLAAATAASAGLIYFLVPERILTAAVRPDPAAVSLKTIYTDPRFWRLAPLSATCVGTAGALQGLWVTPWLTDVEGFERAGVIRYLFIMAVALSIGALIMGATADRLRRRGVKPQSILAVVSALFIAAEFALILRLPLPSYLLWSVIAAVGAAPVLSYSILTDFFPKEATGRANGALNVFHHGGAFVFQYAIGLILGQWTSHAGHYPAIAYKIALGLIVGLQIVALGWFELPRVQAVGYDLARALCRQSPRGENSSEPPHIRIGRLGRAPRVGARKRQRASDLPRPLGWPLSGSRRGCAGGSE
jgi:predicted MFS family arabinose efflux permease